MKGTAQCTSLISLRTDSSLLKILHYIILSHALTLCITVYYYFLGRNLHTQTNHSYCPNIPTNYWQCRSVQYKKHNKIYCQTPIHHCPSIQKGNSNGYRVY